MPKALCGVFGELLEESVAAFDEDESAASSKARGATEESASTPACVRSASRHPSERSEALLLSSPMSSSLSLSMTPSASNTGEHTCRTFRCCCSRLLNCTPPQGGSNAVRQFGALGLVESSQRNGVQFEVRSCFQLLCGEVVDVVLASHWVDVLCVHRVFRQEEDMQEEHGALQRPQWLAFVDACVVGDKPNTVPHELGNVMPCRPRSPRWTTVPVNDDRAGLVSSINFRRGVARAGQRVQGSVDICDFDVAPPIVAGFLVHVGESRSEDLGALFDRVLTAERALENFLQGA